MSTFVAVHGGRRRLVLSPGALPRGTYGEELGPSDRIHGAVRPGQWRQRPAVRPEPLRRPCGRATRGARPPGSGPAGDQRCRGGGRRGRRSDRSPLRRAWSRSGARRSPRGRAGARVSDVPRSGDVLVRRGRTRKSTLTQLARAALVLGVPDPVATQPAQSQAYCGAGHGRRWPVELGKAPPPLVRVQTPSGVHAYRLLMHPRTRGPARDHMGRYPYLPVAPGASAVPLVVGILSPDSRPGAVRPRGGAGRT